MRKIVLLLLAIFLTQLSLLAQEQQTEYITLSGYVKSAGTGDAIPDAEIRAAGTNISNITNEDGFFTLKLPKLPRNLVISAIGYRNQNFPIRNNMEKDKLNIHLVPNTTVLSNVMVYSPKNILLAAVQKIPKTFSNQPELFNTFYRETVRKQRRYVNLSEAVLEMYKTPYKEQVDRDQVHILKGRKLISQRGKDTIAVRVMGGPAEAILLDLVKNRDYLLNEESLNDYYINMEEGKEINDRPQYVISIKPRFVKDLPLYYGTFYIDKEFMAFTRIELSLDVKDQTKATNFMLVHKPASMRFRPKELSTYVNYHYDGVCSRISYIRNIYNFACDWKKRGSSTNYTCVSEMVVTDYKVAEEAPSRKGSFKERDVLDAKVANFNDPAFWENYNTLAPSENLESAVKKLKKRAE